MIVALVGCCLYLIAVLPYIFVFFFGRCCCLPQDKRISIVSTQAYYNHRAVALLLNSLFMLCAPFGPLVKYCCRESLAEIFPFGDGFTYTKNGLLCVDTFSPYTASSKERLSSQIEKEYATLKNGKLHHIPFSIKAKLQDLLKTEAKDMVKDALKDAGQQMAINVYNNVQESVY